MWFDHVRAGSRLPASLMFCDLYEIAADTTFDVYSGQDNGHYFVVHTVAGHGCFHLPQGIVDVRADSLLIVPRVEVYRFRTAEDSAEGSAEGSAGGSWTFWCAVVRAFNGFDLAMNRTHDCPYTATIEAAWREMLGLLREQTSQAEQLAALQLSVFLQRQAWIGATRRRELLPYERQIREQLHHVQSHLDLVPCVEDLARELKLSTRHYREVFRQVTGQSPKAAIDSLRMVRACELLKFTNLRIADIARQTGYGNAQRFSQAFAKARGKAPSHWREMNIS